MNKKAMQSGIIFLIVFGVLFVGWFITNNVYVKYDIVNLDEKNYFCNNNTIELKQTELNKIGFEFRQGVEDECSLRCDFTDNYKNFYKQKNIFYCESDNPICECKASFYSYRIYPLFRTS